MTISLCMNTTRPVPRLFHLPTCMVSPPLRAALGISFSRLAPLLPLLHAIKTGGIHTTKSASSTCRNQLASHPADLLPARLGDLARVKSTHLVSTVLMSGPLLNRVASPAGLQVIGIWDLLLLLRPMPRRPSPAPCSLLACHPAVLLRLSYPPGTRLELGQVAVLLCGR
jgi:hypothetical protein